MITKILGSVSDFINCDRIAFIGMPNDEILVESKISTYTVSYFTLERDDVKVKMSERYEDEDGNEYFRFRFTKRDENDEVIIVDGKAILDDFIGTHLVMYNATGEPLGFVDLTQKINIRAYGIWEIDLAMEYDIEIQNVEFNVNIDYKEHIILTGTHEVHHRLQEVDMASERAVRSSEVNIYTRRKSFTKNLIEALHDNRMMFRYSGKVSKYLNDKDLGNELTEIELGQIKMNEYTLSSGELDLENELVDIVRSEGSDYLIRIIKGALLSIQKLVANQSSGSVTEPTMSFEIPISSLSQVGGNIVIDDTGKVYDFRELVKGTSGNLDLYVHTYRLQDGYNSEDNIDVDEKVKIADSTRFVKNPFTKELLACQVNSKGHWIPMNLELEKVISDFGGATFTDRIIYAAPGFLVSVNKNTQNIRIFNYKHPGYFKGSELVSEYEDYILPSSANLIPITRDLIYYPDAYKLLLLSEYSIKEYSVSDYKFKNLSRLIKTFDYEVKDYVILPIAMDGCLYTSNGTILRKL
jgi:hypothetical protein